MSDSADPTQTTRPIASRDMKDLAPEEFYLEDAKVVFTAIYHLNRGYCCNSGCRHCPYRW